MNALPHLHTVIGVCGCREWVLAAGSRWGRCGYCHQRPVGSHDDPDCRCPMCKETR